MKRAVVPVLVALSLVPVLALGLSVGRAPAEAVAAAAESVAPESQPAPESAPAEATPPPLSTESVAPVEEPPSPERIALYQDLAAQVNRSRIESGVRNLASLGSRISGTPGSLAAGAWVVGQFQSIGLSKVRIEEFDVTIPVNYGSSLDIDGEKVTLYPLWPNLVRTCKVAAEGLKAALVDGGTGSLGDLSGKPIEGSVVLMDYAEDISWFNAPLLGAVGVVFIEPELISRGGSESKFLSIPADMPRFWIPRKEGLALRERLKSAQTPPTVTLRADVRWESRRTFNVLGEIEGTETEPLPGASNVPGNGQRVLVTAYYDSMSVVPDLAPGAESASSITAMLEVARALKSHPPRRSVLFLATSGHFQALCGIRDFVRRRFDALKRSDADVDKILEAGGPRPDTVGPMDIAAGFGIDISSQNDLVCAFYKGYFYEGREDIQWKYADFGKYANRHAAAIAQALGMRGPVPFADAINSITGKNWRSYLPGRMAMDFEEVPIASRPAIGFCTGNDMRALVDTPHDTPDRVSGASIQKQARLLACLLRDVIDDDKLGGIIDKNGKYAELDKDLCCIAQGRVVEFQPKNNEYLPNTPVPGAVCVTRTYPKTSVGVRGDAVLLVDREAKFAYNGLPNVKWGRGGFAIEAYFLDPGNGAIIMAPDRGPNGDKLRPLVQNIDAATKDWKITLFNCATTNLFDIIDQRQFMLCGAMAVLDSVSDAEPFQFGMALPEPTPQWASYFEPVATVFAAKQVLGSSRKPVKSDQKLKLLMGAGALGMRFLLLNSDEAHPEGVGFDFTQYPRITPTPWYVVRDMWVLDDVRMRTLHRYGIENRICTDLHANAKVYIADAEKALKGYQYRDFFTNVRTALAYEMRVYPEVRKTAADVVKGVIFYLALLIPFAYFLERLLVASPHVVRQVAWACGFFGAIFIILWFVHPAFEITQAPIIVLLAFIMLSLSGMVGSLIVSRFDHRMRVLRQQITGVRETDVGRLGASGMAFALGVANMRRRKTRTVLTCITLILLTFTVISFTSVVAEVKMNKRRTDPGGDYQGLLIRDLRWEPIGLPAKRILENEYAGQEGVSIAARVWYMAVQVGNVSFVPVQYRDKSVDTRALVGFAPSEEQVTQPSRALVAGRWFRDDDRGPKCMLPLRLANQLGLSEKDVASDGKPGTIVRVLGESAELIAVFDPAEFNAIKDVDSEPLTPVDYQLMQDQRRQGGSSQGQSEDQVERYIHLNPDQVALVNIDFALDAGGGLRSVAMNFGTQERLEKQLQPLIQRIELNIYAKIGDGNFLLSTRASQAVKGAGSVLIPLIIAALIVLNTMLGSVYERTREIAIFSAVGLAPVHVASLFVAEALVYAVLGAVCGYLLGQGVAKAIVVWNVLPELNLNYSSVSAVATTIIVMITVLASTAYPARMASRLATPGVDRRWKMVDPKEGVLAVELPFSSAEGDVRGLNMFLNDYFSAHVEYSTGRFSADNVEVARMVMPIVGVDHPSEVFQLRTTLWLAPYDLGVRERFTLVSLPTPEMGPASYGFWAVVHREDGDEASWVRLTRNLLTILRQQFLLWRTFDLDTRKPYVERDIEFTSGDPSVVAIVEAAQREQPTGAPLEQPGPAIA